MHKNMKHPFLHLVGLLFRNNKTTIPHIKLNLYYKPRTFLLKFQQDRSTRTQVDHFVYRQTDRQTDDDDNKDRLTT
jgi:hypothetical protein